MKHLGEHSKVDTKHLWHIMTGTEPSNKWEMGREQLVWRFTNGYGVSLACNSITNWNIELAVVKFDETKNEYKLDYSTPVTDDVLCGVESSELPAIFETIKNL